MEAKNAVIGGSIVWWHFQFVSVEDDNPYDCTGAIGAKTEYYTFDSFPVLIWLDPIYNFKTIIFCNFILSVEVFECH